MANTRKRRKSKSEPKWRLVEKVVGLVETAIDPAATVEHNVMLPDLTNPGHHRQCDVVVITGAESRRTRTIVEVQKRKTRVSIGAFDGWVEKMRTVGAQHLVCVSAVGFPSSVISKAARLGPTVRLVTLKELERNSARLQASLGTIFLFETGTKDFPSVELLVAKPSLLSSPGGEILQHVPLFKSASGALLSLNNIAKDLLDADARPGALPNGIHPLSYETSEKYTYVGDPSMGPVRLRFTANVRVHRDLFQCEVSEYIQDFETEPLAWTLLGTASSPDKLDPYHLRIVFRPDASGRLVPHSFQIDGLERDDSVTFRMKGRTLGGP